MLCLSSGPCLCPATQHSPNPQQAPHPVINPTYLGTHCRRLLRLIALSLGLPADHFASFFSSPMIFLRPLHYAAQVSKPDDGVYGAGAHSDYGMLTILATDDVPGLQIHRDSTGWVDVAPVPGTYIINLGDMLQR